MIGRYTAPRIYFGWDALETLEEFRATRVGIVSDEAMRGLGYVARVEGIFAKAGIKARAVGWVNREPQVADVMPLVDELREYAPDLVVALGGGAVMDAAKAAWALYEHPGLGWQTLLTANGLPPFQGRAQFVAVPTTSGSGSEVSKVAVLIDGQTRLKRLAYSQHLVPHAAILDPALTLTMPQALTAHSGFDALTHAVEAMTTRATNEFSRANALYAVELIFGNLRGAIEKNDHTAREKMHYAATLASLAVSNSFAGLAHGMDQVGPLFHLPHGLVCATLLPHTMRFQLETALDAYARLGSAVGLRMNDARERAEGFLRQVVELQRTVNLPTSLAQCGVGEADFFRAMETLVNATRESRSTQLSARVPDTQETRELFERAYWGN